MQDVSKGRENLKTNKRDILTKIMQLYSILYAMEIIMVAVIIGWINFHSSSYYWSDQLMHDTDF